MARNSLEKNKCAKGRYSTHFAGQGRRKKRGKGSHLRIMHGSLLKVAVFTSP